MKITRRHLRKIIKEATDQQIRPNRQPPRGVRGTEAEEVTGITASGKGHDVVLPI